MSRLTAAQINALPLGTEVAQVNWRTGQIVTTSPRYVCVGVVREPQRRYVALRNCNLWIGPFYPQMGGSYVFRTPKRSHALFYDRHNPQHLTYFGVVPDEDRLVKFRP